METHVKNLFDPALAPARQKKAEQNRKIWVPEFSRFKLQFIYRNGQHSTPYHSYDIHKAKGAANVTDEAVGLSKLLLLVDKKRQLDDYVVATIWANLTGDLRTYIDGKLNMNYDLIVYKHVRGQKAFSLNLCKFPQGKLNVTELYEYYLKERRTA